MFSRIRCSKECTLSHNALVNLTIVPNFQNILKLLPIKAMGVILKIFHLYFKLIECPRLS